MTKTPDHQLPTIRDTSTVGVRFSVGTWCLIVAALVAGLSTLIGFVLWLNNLHDAVDGLKGTQLRQADTLERIESSLREIEFRQKYGITAGLPAVVKVSP